MTTLRFPRDVGAHYRCRRTLRYHRPMIRDATLDDAPAVAAVYNPYIIETDISFEETPVSDAEMAERMAAVQCAYPWLVYEVDQEIIGYAYASRWHVRHAYRYSVETSIYLKRDVLRRGIGRALYAELLSRIAAQGIRVAIGGIALPNDASIALHEKFGFEKVALYPSVGFKFGRWIDVSYWQKFLDDDTEL